MRSYDGEADGTFSFGNNWRSGTNDVYLEEINSDVRLVQNATGGTTFVSNGSGYDPPEHSPLLLEADAVAKIFIVTNRTTRKQWIFHDFTVANATHRGKLIEATRECWRTAGKSGLVYTLNSSGQVSGVITSSGQGYVALFTYTTGGLVSGVALYDGTTKIREVNYTYFDSTTHSADLGTVNDLVAVKRSRLVRDGWIHRYTQYRYDGSSQLKAVITNAGVQRLIEQYSGISSPDDILTKDDDHPLSGSSLELQHFAKKWFEYYSSDIDTTSVVTGWSTMAEDLERYVDGAGARDETGMVKSERIARSGCSSCGSGVTKKYYYLETNAGDDGDDNEVRYVVIEDTIDTADTAVYRSIAGLNAFGKLLRTATTYDPTVSSPDWWCRSWTLMAQADFAGANSQKRNHIKEYRTPAAHDVSSEPEMREFLNPYNATTQSWTNDENSLKAKAESNVGPTWTNRYNASGRLTEKRVKRGHDATDEWLFTSYEFGNGTTEPDYKKTTTKYYPTKTDSTASGKATTRTYEYWDTGETQIKKVTRTYPVVSTDENGSGVAVTDEVYYDKLGRVRWYKDGDGYIQYYSYCKHSGRWALHAADVDPTSLSTITAANDSSIVSWIDDGDGNNSYDTAGIPTRDSGLPTPVAMTVLQEYDELGRRSVLTRSDGTRKAIVYESNRVLVFPFIDSLGQPLYPISVRVFDEIGKTTESFEVAANFGSVDASGGLPTGFSAEPDQDDYVSWTRTTYDEIDGRILYVDRYHDIPSNGTGSISTNFGRTGYRYDSLGRREYVIEQVSGDPASSDGVEQVNQTVYDEMGRIQAVRRGVSKASHTIAADYSNAGATPTLQTTAETFYDGSTFTTAIAVGNGRVTRSKAYHEVNGSGVPTAYTVVKYHRDFRGRLRGTERFYNGESASDSVGPYTVVDIDWLGRTTTESLYDTTPNWSAITADDGDSAYAATTTTDRRGMSRMLYNSAGQLYRSEEVVVSESTGAEVAAMRTDNYYDARGYLAASGDPFGMSNEYAYDGVGRQYQSRKALALETTKYSGTDYQYLEPQPKPGAVTGLSSSSADGVMSFSHDVYGATAASKPLVVETHSFTANHDNSAGITLTGSTPATTDYIRSTSHTWYDSLGRVITMASYGSGNDTSTANTWQYTSPPTYGTAPTTTDDKKIVTKLGYDAATGSNTILTDQDGRVDKTFYDDLGRQTFVAENYTDFSPDPVSGVGGGTNEDQDRVTGWEYDAYGNLVALTAYNASSSTVDQVTRYVYEDDHDATLATKTIYPDGDASTDNVRVAYHMDGSQDTRTDQRGVVIETVYDDARRPTVNRVTAFGGSGAVDETIKAISTTYDELGRTQKVTSHGNAATDPTDTTDVENQIEYTYDDAGATTASAQSHSGIVDGTTPEVQYAYDTSTDTAGGGTLFDDGRRLETITYPAGRVVYYDYGSSGSFGDRQTRVTAIRDGSSSADILASYEHTGSSRLAETEYPEPEIHQHADRDGNGEYDLWDRFGRVLDVAWRKTGGAGDHLDAFSYAYDLNGNRVARNARLDLVAGANLTEDNRDQIYTYDALNRLVNADQGTAAATHTTLINTTSTEAWTLDQLGNWSEYQRDDNANGSPDLNQTRTHNAANELLTQTVWQAPSYDAAGSMTAIPQPNAPTSVYSMTYDAWNRLVELRDGAAPVQTYKYDGLDRRASRTEGPTQEHYYYDEAWQCVEEWTGSSTEGRTELVWGPHYADELILRDRDTTAGGPTDERRYATHDTLYSVTGTFGTTALVDQRFSYTVYGEGTELDPNFTASTGSGNLEWEHRYTARRLDSATGLQLNRHRFYHQQLGRWTARDPLSYAGGSSNLYEYVDSQPQMKVDPSGLTSLTACLKGPVALSLCLQEGIVSWSQVGARFCGKKGGKELIKVLKKWGGEVVKGGKGSHTKIQMPSGRVETVPQCPGSGTAIAIMKRVLGDF